jgi:hypothetical protein
MYAFIPPDNYQNITVPVEFFIMEVECYNLTTVNGVLVDIYLQVAADVHGNFIIGNSDCPYDHTLYVKLLSAVGGVQLPIDKLSLLTPSIGLATTALTAVAATALCTRRFKRRKSPASVT